MFCHLNTLVMLVALVSWVNAEQIGKYSLNSFDRARIFKQKMMTRSDVFVINS